MTGVADTTANSADESLNCMEVRGGYQAINSHYTTAGMKIWLYSRPHQDEATGGDVYYLSSCASGRITRVLLADISGHGSQMGDVSQSMRKMMRKNINRISSRNLIAQLNRDFEASDENGYFATGLVGTYFCPTKTLTIHNAGHPAPLHWSVRDSSWSLLEGRSTSSSVGPANLPLGVTGNTNYDSTRFKMQEGDLLLFYTDGLSEARQYGSKVLGIEGLLDLVKQVELGEPATFIPRLLDRVRTLTGDDLQKDDLTLILAQIQPGHISLADNLMAPIRLLNSVMSGR